MEKQLFKDFVEGERYKVEILAIIVVPQKLVAAICFPDHQTDNKCPHVTLMINEWPAKMSNRVIEACCTYNKAPFAQQYEELRVNGRVLDGDELQYANVKIDKNGPSSPCYFIALQNPVVFEGITQTYY